MKGGYTLARDAGQITLWDVFGALADPLVRPQADLPRSAQAEEQTLKEVFRTLEREWEKDLKEVSLADLRESTLKNPKLDSAPREGVRFQI
jgi:DNA-binding IscR family transcriptional regulator